MQEEVVVSNVEFDAWRLSITRHVAFSINTVLTVSRKTSFLKKQMRHVSILFLLVACQDHCQFSLVLSLIIDNNSLPKSDVSCKL